MNNQVEVTAKIIDRMADMMRHSAIKLNEDATNLREDSDFAHAGNAMNTLINALVNMRLDLLVTKSLKDDWFDDLKG